MRHDLVVRFKSRWDFARGLTRDLLMSLDTPDLLYTPDDRIGALWKHFRHIGRVQENYLRALEVGEVKFGFDGATYKGGASKQELAHYLDELDAELGAKLPILDRHDPTVRWADESVDCYEHLTRMADHELLHHGMFIVIMRLLGRAFPKSWQAWGVQ